MKIKMLFVGLVLGLLIAVVGIWTYKNSYNVGDQVAEEQIDARDAVDDEKNNSLKVKLPESTKKHKLDDKMIFFEHPDWGYRLEYSNIWAEENGSASSDFIVLSPDYQISSGYPVLEQGASLRVNVKKTTIQSSSDLLEKDPLANRIAQNQKEVVVDGVKAIQYDYSFEGTSATITRLVHKGKEYNLRIRYADKQSKEKYWDDYKNMINSFSFRN